MYLYSQLDRCFECLASTTCHNVPALYNCHRFTVDDAAWALHSGIMRVHSRRAREWCEEAAGEYVSILMQDCKYMATDYEVFVVN